MNQRFPIISFLVQTFKIIPALTELLFCDPFKKALKNLPETSHFQWFLQKPIPDQYIH